jgi:thymidylate kinase
MEFFMTANDASMGPMIAVIGCDGSGKSTVSERIVVWANDYGPAATAHLGKQAGNVGRALTGLPLVGNLIGRFIGHNNFSLREPRAKNKTPGILAALVASMFTLRRVLRFRRMLSLRRQGFIVITDRFPQLDYPNSFDGPVLSETAQGSFFVRWLARQERVAFQWMTSYRPDLVIRLNIDLDTACARKPDHVRRKLQRKVEITPLLTFGGAPIVEIDSAQPLEEVLVEAREAVTRFLTGHGLERLKYRRGLE